MNHIILVLKNISEWKPAYDMWVAVHADMLCYSKGWKIFQKNYIPRFQNFSELNIFNYIFHHFILI